MAMPLFYLTNIISLSTILLAQAAVAAPVAGSREYKVMLNSNQFTYGNEAAQVYQLSQDLKHAIEPAISRDVYGALSLSKTRTVRFFDTPHTCLLNNNGYSFRERMRSGDSEVTLKFRSPDLLLSAYEDVDSSTKHAETKLEADIGADAYQAIKVVYGHSTTVPNKRKINRMDDIQYHFKGFKENYPFNGTLSLAPVGGLTIKEQVYKNLYIDLGSIDAEVSVTLWYTQSQLTRQSKPTVAEVSFKYKDASGRYTPKVINRSLVAFESMQGLSNWVNPNAMTKTKFVYNYDMSFCS